MVLAQKHIHFHEQNEEDDVDIIARNSVNANIRNALTSYFEAQM